MKKHNFALSFKNEKTLLLQNLPASGIEGVEA